MMPRKLQKAKPNLRTGRGLPRLLLKSQSYLVLGLFNLARPAQIFGEEWHCKRRKRRKINNA
jgi:hypothetical protein